MCLVGEQARAVFRAIASIAVADDIEKQDRLLLPITTYQQVTALHRRRIGRIPVISIRLLTVVYDRPSICSNLVGHVLFTCVLNQAQERSAAISVRIAVRDLIN